METWREIVAEMRGMREFYGAEYRALADRIEKACKTLEENERIAIQSAQARHDEEVNALKCENAKLRKEYDKEHLRKLKFVQHEGELITANCELREENAKLRRALEPVMNVILGGSSLTDSYEAVRDAQAIAKCENLFTAKAKTRNNKGKIKNEHQ